MSEDNNVIVNPSRNVVLIICGITILTLIIIGVIIGVIFVFQTPAQNVEVGNVVIPVPETINVNACMEHGFVKEDGSCQCVGLWGGQNCSVQVPNMFAQFMNMGRSVNSVIPNLILGTTTNTNLQNCLTTCLNTPGCQIVNFDGNNCQYYDTASTSEIVYNHNTQSNLFVTNPHALTLTGMGFVYRGQFPSTMPSAQNLPNYTRITDTVVMEVPYVPTYLNIPLGYAMLISNMQYYRSQIPSMDQQGHLHACRFTGPVTLPYAANTKLYITLWKL